MIEVIIAAIVLLVLASAGMGIKLLFDRNAEFSGGSCQSTNSSDALNSKGISCGCGGGCNEVVK